MTGARAGAATGRQKHDSEKKGDDNVRKLVSGGGENDIKPSIMPNI
jgi:hypothetical protein